MMINVDYLVVGSGLTGATIARRLHDAGREVLVVERRPHCGGNVWDRTWPCGIRVHEYGPHYFRTKSERIWRYVTRFADFYPFEAVVQSRVAGRFENWPVAGSYLRRRVGDARAPESVGTPQNLEEAALSLMPQGVYEDFVKEYNEKQWGVPATALSPDLCRRFDIHWDDDPRLKPLHRWQGLPKEGYAAFMTAMLEGIPLLLNTDYLAVRGRLKARRCLIFTGPIDEFFEFRLGRLGYRSQNRTHSYLPDADFEFPCGQINFPRHSDGPHIRIVEWKHLMEDPYAERIRGTVLTTETPYTPTRPNEYEYPFPDSGNRALYEQYRLLVKDLRGVTICGRLGEYRYLDMDQAIARAFALGTRVLEDHVEGVVSS